MYDNVFSNLHSSIDRNNLVLSTPECNLVIVSCSIAVEVWDVYVSKRRHESQVCAMICHVKAQPRKQNVLM